MKREEVADAIAAIRQSACPQLVFAQRATVVAPRTLGVLSASFNPLTMAHARMLEVAHEQFHFDEWLLVLALANVDKRVYGFAIEDRVAFLQTWVQSLPRASVALCSHGRFVEKIEAIRASYHDARVYFILGYDTLVRLFDPKYYDDMQGELSPLFDQCEIIAMNRGEANLSTVKAFTKRPEVKPFAVRIHVVALDKPAAVISSTQVRERLREGKSIERLVPPEVARQMRR